jgi:DNA-binding MarR family transcriptional regulator/N-acetylglutamate synthase-like GNAT family acetyltransferase
MTLIKQLGELAFGTRLKLLTESLIQDASKVYRAMNIDFEPRWFAMFYLLNTKSPLSVTEIANELEITQPAVTQLADLLIKKGYISHVKDKTDTRKRMLALSKKGKELIPRLEPVWQSFKDATKELFDSAGYDMLLVLTRLENALNEKDMFTRITEDIKRKQGNKVKVIDYKPEYKEYFKKLNYEWLNKYFSVEEADRRILNNPEEEIINKGGYIFFAGDGNEILATAALLKHSEKIYELAKMAVTEKAQRRQIGKQLALHVIEKAKYLNAQKLFLETNIKLDAAYNLYRKLGFEEVGYEPDKKSKYERATTKMELKLKK